MKSFLSLAVPSVIILVAVAASIFLLTGDIREIRLCAAVKMHYQETGKVPGSWTEIPSVEHLVRHPDGFAYRLACHDATCSVTWDAMEDGRQVHRDRSCGPLDSWSPADFY